jgi:endonuclease YncB( thermonuclease family)
MDRHRRLRRRAPATRLAKGLHGGAGDGRRRLCWDRGGVYPGANAQSGAAGAELATASEIEWNAVQALPAPAKAAEDAAWEQAAGGSGETGLPRAAGARNDGVKAAFGSCKWGGGTNCVVDGDTFYIGGEKVRIAGVDAPETHDYRCGSELALGNQAAERLQALLNSGAVTMTGIEGSAQSSTLSGGNSRDRDTYGRLLRNVQVNGADVGEALIGAGVARAYGGGRRSWC